MGGAMFVFFLSILQPAAETIHVWQIEDGNGVAIWPVYDPNQGRSGTHFQPWSFMPQTGPLLITTYHI
jgi:hypothetical protein